MRYTFDREYRHPNDGRPELFLIRDGSDVIAWTNDAKYAERVTAALNRTELMVVGADGALQPAVVYFR